MPPGAQPSICLSTDDLPNMGDKISTALRQWSRGDEPFAMDDSELSKVMTGSTAQVQDHSGSM